MTEVLTLAMLKKIQESLLNKEGFIQLTGDGWAIFQDGKWVLLEEGIE